MKPVSYVITNFIEQTMNLKGLNLYVTSDGKYLAMDNMYDTVFKFDLMFSDNDFSCQILGRSEQGLVMKHSVNIPWSNGAALREFMNFVRNL